MACRIVGNRSIPGRQQFAKVYTFHVSHVTQEASYMSMQTELAEIEQLHRALEDEIREALAHPSTDDLAIIELKRRKLQLKDEMARMRLNDSVH